MYQFLLLSNDVKCSSLKLFSPDLNTSPLCLPLFSSSSDTKKDLKQITSHLLDMLVSKKVSGQGRDQALNLLNKNVPRKDLSIHDNSRTIYVVDNGEEVVGLGLTPAFPVGTRAHCTEQKVEEA